MRGVCACAALLLCLVALPRAQSYAQGAPDDSCADLTPQHGVPPQTGPSPYALSAARARDGAVALTLKGAPFKGFLVTARDSKGASVGSFRQSPGARVVACSGPGSASGATHTDPKEKESVTAHWEPKGFKGTVNFYYTTAKNGGEFWVGQKSQPFTV